MIQRVVAKGNNCLFIAHRKEIISQTSEKLDTFGIDHGVIMSGHNRYKPNHPVQLASIQTLTNRHKPRAELVIIDETHLACSASFQKIIEHYEGIRLRIQGNTGETVKIQIGSQTDPFTEPVWGDVMNHVIGSTIANDCLVSGRYIAVRFSTGTAYQWRLDSYDIDVQNGGSW